MTYSLDLRERVVAFVRGGGSKTEAARRFGVSRGTVYGWLAAPTLTPKAHGPRQRKLDKDALRRNVAAHPDLLLRERAAVFGVTVNAMWEALRAQGLDVKKNLSVRRA